MLSVSEEKKTSLFSQLAKGSLNSYFESLVNSMTVLFVAVYGSQVYGSATTTSDTDIIIIVDDLNGKDKDHHHTTHDPSKPETMYDVTIMTLSSFMKMFTIEDGDPKIFEILFTPKDFVIFGYDYLQKLALSIDVKKMIKDGTLRKIFSQKISNNEARFKKKANMENNLLISLKTAWHNYRLTLFAIQLGTSGMIYDFQMANSLLATLKKDCLSGTLTLEQIQKQLDQALTQSSFHFVDQNDVIPLVISSNKGDQPIPLKTFYKNVCSDGKIFYNVDLLKNKKDVLRAVVSLSKSK